MELLNGSDIWAPVALYMEPLNGSDIWAPVALYMEPLNGSDIWAPVTQVISTQLFDKSCTE